MITMKLVCPSCGLIASAEAWFNDAAARDLLLAVATLPAPLPKSTLPYLGLFRPEKQALRWEKAGKIVSELAGAVQSGHVQVQGKVARPCPPRIWAQAMEQMVERRESIRRPLPNHNYLKQVAWQLADEEDAKGEAARRHNEASGAIGRRGGHTLTPALSQRERGNSQDLSQGERGNGQDLSQGEREDVGLKPGLRMIDPMTAYIQGHREDKPSQEEIQEWFAGRMR